MLDRLQQDTCSYFLKHTNRRTGLVQDKAKCRRRWPASIAATGFGLAAYPVAVERSFVSRLQAVQRTLTTLRFFWNSPQSEASDATGYRGFYYHFLDMKTGRRAWECELSTIDSGFLLAGALAAAAYFDRDSAEEREIRQLADALYRRADWQWAQAGGATVSHGWTPERGFLPYRWEGYSEALVLYALGLGSPTYPLAEASYEAWMSSYRWEQAYDKEFLYAGPLFIHQLSHLWIDFREIQDAFMRARGTDYFENSRRATYIQQEYAIRNPHGFAGYGEHCWGVTHSDGPGFKARRSSGVTRSYFGYLPRGVPHGPDDGTLAAWAVITSLPFAPEIVLPTIRHLRTEYPEMATQMGFRACFNPTYGARFPKRGPWVCKWHYGLNQGPAVLMIENFRSGLLWSLMKRCPYLVTGLRRAGFTGGWLSEGPGDEQLRDTASRQSGKMAEQHRTT